jgi:hypothetical protein
MRLIVIVPVLAAFVLVGCSSSNRGRRSSCCGSGMVGPGQGDASRAPLAMRAPASRGNAALPGAEYARHVAAVERQTALMLGGPGIADVWARTRNDGSAYFAGGGSSDNDTRLQLGRGRAP